MDKDQVARLSLYAALGSVTLGVLVVAVFSILVATLPGPNAADASNFASIYDWQQRIQQYTALRDMGQAFVFASIPFAILAVGLNRAAQPEPPRVAGAATLMPSSESTSPSSRRKIP